MKNTGKILVLFLPVLIGSIAFAAGVETNLRENRISVGRSTVLNIKISGASSDIKPVRAPVIKGLDISYSGISNQYQYINGNVWRGVVITYTIYAKKKGKYKIPPFIFDISGRKVMSKTVTLIVSKSGYRDEDGIKRLGPDYSISGKEAYIGEPLILRYYLLSTGLRSINSSGIEHKPEGKGLIINEFEESIDDEIVTVDNIEMVKSHILTMLLLPAETGRLKAGGGSVKVSFNIDDSFFRFTRDKLIEYDTIDLNILPLPTKGQPKNFHGDVGSFKLFAEIEPGVVDMYEEKKLNISVKGRGNFLTMAMPFTGKDIEGLRIISSGTKSNLNIVDNKIEGEKIFVYTLIPEKKGKIDIGKISLSFFNPEKKIYETVETENIFFNVIGGNGGNKGKEAAEFDSDDGKVYFKPVYFILALIVTAIVVSAVIIRDRKRYNLIPGNKENGNKDEVKQDEYFDINKLTMDMKRGLDLKDPGLFVVSANRYINLLSKNIREKALKDNYAAEINKLKDELNSYSYGGNKITGEDMERIYSDLSDIGSGINRL